MSNKIQIIYLNGPSSSGKTTLSLALQDTLDIPFFHVSLDKVISMMPKKINNFEGGEAPLGYSWKKVKDASGSIVHEIQVGLFAQKIAPTFREIVFTMAQMGHFLIVDDVSFGITQVNLWKDKLKEFSVLWVGIEAPLKALEQREKKRNNRILGSAKAQHGKTHIGVKYDLILDPYKDSVETNVNKIQKFLVK